MVNSLNHYSQNTEIGLIKILAEFLTNRNFIDIGAEKGTFASTLLELGLKGVLFEPMPKHLPDLQKLVSKYRDVALHIYAITNIDTKQQFNVATDSDGHELDYYHSLQKAEAFGVFSHSKTFEVECRSICSLVDEGEIPSVVGILKTDTEGNDLNVLRGLGVIRPEIVVCEYFTQGLYDGWVEGAPEKIIEHMRNLGYQMFLVTKRIDDLESVQMCMPLFEEKQWGNLFFFREDFYKKAYAVIAECVFNSEKNLLLLMNKLKIDLEAKEKVIRILDAEITRMTKLQAENGILKKILNKIRL